MPITDLPRRDDYRMPSPPATKEVEISGLNFQGVGFVRIMASPNLSLHKALTMAETSIRMMRAELEEAAKAAETGLR